MFMPKKPGIYKSEIAKMISSKTPANARFRSVLDFHVSNKLREKDANINKIRLLENENNSNVIIEKMSNGLQFDDETALYVEPFVYREAFIDNHVDNDKNCRNNTNSFMEVVNKSIDHSSSSPGTNKMVRDLTATPRRIKQKRDETALGLTAGKKRTKQVQVQGGYFHGMCIYSKKSQERDPRDDFDMCTNFKAYGMNVISGEKIKRFPKCFKKFNDLHRLTIHDARDLDSIENIEYLEKLDELQIKDSAIESIDGIENNVKLKTLEITSGVIDDNYIGGYYGGKRGKLASLAPLKKLQENKMKDENYRREDRERKNKTEDLYRIEVFGNKLYDLEGISSLTGLNYLDARYNDLETMKGMAGANNMSNLLLDHNKITVIEGLAGMGKLKELNLSNNEIEKIPEEMRGSADGDEKKFGHSLEKLNLSNNKIKSIENLDNLDEVKTMHLNGNLVENLDKITMRRLNVLIIDNNIIKEIKNLDGFRSVTRLYLSNNFIEKIENLEPMKNLEKLDIGYNRIARMEGLESLKKIERLDLANNKISKIEGIDGLVNLESIDLRHNGIKKVEGIDTLKKLKSIDLGTNPIAKIEPGTFLKLPIEVINLSYIKDLLIDGSVDEIFPKSLKEVDLKGSNIPKNTCNEFLTFPGITVKC
jgi:Leucine-rich repeat (LRR) protein